MATKKKITKKVTKKAKKEKTFVLFVLDESGSMSSIANEAVGAFNQHLEDIRKSTKGTGIGTKVSLVKFNTIVPNPVYWCKPLKDVKPIVLGEDYSPDGLTAMLDAVGFSISKLEKEKDFTDKTDVLVVIISDGMENNSKEHTYKSLAETIQKLTDKGNWTFTYAGANQDLSVVSKSLNIPMGNTQAFVATATGMTKSVQMRCASFDNYFKGKMLSHDQQYNVGDFYSSVDKDDSEKEDS